MNSRQLRDLIIQHERVSHEYRTAAEAWAATNKSNPPSAQELIDSRERLIEAFDRCIDK